MLEREEGTESELESTGVQKINSIQHVSGIRDSRLQAEQQCFDSCHGCYLFKKLCAITVTDSS
jgi:hypothetical protein